MVYWAGEYHKPKALKVVIMTPQIGKSSEAVCH